MSIQHFPGFQQLFMIFCLIELIKLQVKKWKHWKKIEVYWDYIDNLRIDDNKKNWSIQDVEKALSSLRTDQVT